MVARKTRVPCRARPRASSNEYVHTPPTVSALIRTRRGLDFNTYLISFSVNCIKSFSHLSQRSDLRIKAVASRQMPGPVHGDPPAPRILRSRQRLAPRSTKPFRLKLVEGAVDIPEPGAAFGPVKRPTDYCVASRRQFPRAGNLRTGAVGQVKPRQRVILDDAVPGADRLALREQSAANVGDFRIVQSPKRHVDEVNSQIDHTAAT